jgi:hypothetical protein
MPTVKRHASTHDMKGLKSLVSKATDPTIGRLNFSGTTPRGAGMLTGDSRKPSKSAIRTKRSTQHPRQILSLRSTAASSALSCSRTPAFSNGRSPACGWRWPIGAPTTHRVSRANDEAMVGLAGPADDRPRVCAIAIRPPNRASNTAVLIKFRMIGSPETIAHRSLRCVPTPVGATSAKLDRLRYRAISISREINYGCRRDAAKTRRSRATRKHQLPMRFLT